jgi:uroporphyrinogen III methyltransferase/synthase
MVSPEALPELATELESCGARVISWPAVEVGDPESFTALDEAIENLFGYDWLLFRNAHAAEFFVKRFQNLGHEVSEVDTLRICAIGKATVEKLQALQMHIDVIPTSPNANIVADEIGNYVGGGDALGRLNFLVPQASATRHGLCALLEEAGARVDEILAYRTVPANSSLTHLTALLAGGGIDCVVFDSPSSVWELAELFDTLDLAKVLDGIQIFAFDESTTKAAGDFGLRPLVSSRPTTGALATAIAEHFRDDR